MTKRDYSERIQNVKIIISDVDGVLTDGSVYIHSDGTESKKFSVRDGAGAATCRLANIPIVLISARESKTTLLRANEMQITHVYQGELNKLKIFKRVINEFNLTSKETAYIGDGLVDIPVMGKCGFRIAPPDGHPRILELVDYITKREGGSGVLQEAVELILHEQGKLETVLDDMRNGVFGT